MMDAEGLLVEIKRLNPHRAISLSWINPKSPVMRANTYSIKLPEGYYIDSETGNIMAKKHEGSSEICLYVDYTTQATKKFGLFRRKKFA